ncbi:MAG: N-acetylmuramoyl-L-alanine amidase [Lachnospiraceae bacterium]|nr:N-acetylmuramoyl-L-alanine amidase [Lachnospiraceae bacterium]
MKYIKLLIIPVMITCIAMLTGFTNNYENGAKIGLDRNWKYSDESVINSGSAVMYKAKENRKNITVGVNAGHGTKGGTSVKTYCHPDHTAKLTGGSTASGAVKATAVSSGMVFKDGTGESKAVLKTALMLKDILLANGYDVLMIREGDDVQLDNVARTVICNNAADCHIAIHFDGDGLDYDKGCFYISTPEGLKSKEPVKSVWQESEELGKNLIEGLRGQGCKIKKTPNMDIDLTQTSYSSIPSVDIELGNQCTDHSDKNLEKMAQGLARGVDTYFCK